MIRVALVVLPLMLGTWNLVLGPSPAGVLVTLAGVVACLAGAAQHNERLLTGGVVALVLGFLAGLVTGGRLPQMWGGLLVGMGLLLVLELCLDRAVLFRGRPHPGSRTRAPDASRSGDRVTM